MLKRGKVISQVIKIDDGEVIKEIGEVYEYIRVIKKAEKIED